MILRNLSAKKEFKKFKKPLKKLRKKREEKNGLVNIKRYWKVQSKFSKKMNKLFTHSYPSSVMVSFIIKLCTLSGENTLKKVMIQVKDNVYTKVMRNILHLVLTNLYKIMFYLNKDYF